MSILGAQNINSRIFFGFFIEKGFKAKLAFANSYFDTFLDKNDEPPNAKNITTALEYLKINLSIWI